MSTKKTLILSPLKFYSSDDEKLFFKWIDKIKCIKSYEGAGRELHARVDESRHITFNEYRNLYGIFKRYHLDHCEQLKVLFMTEENKEWFE
jgi:hypothetical protein